MKKQIGALVVLSGLSLGGCSTLQAPPDCQMAHDANGSGIYIAKYTLVSKTGTGTCGELKGEMVGVRKFNVDETRTGNPVVAVKSGLDKFQLDFSSLGAELKPSTTGMTADQLKAYKKTAEYKYAMAKYNAVQASVEYSVGSDDALTEGNFTSIAAPADGICAVDGLKPVETKAAQALYLPFSDTNYTQTPVDANGDGQADLDADKVPMYTWKPATTDKTTVPADKFPDVQQETTLDVKYSDVKVYVDALSPGQSWTGKLDYTETKADGTSCSAQYNVKAMIPAVACETDADCHPCVPSSGFVASGINPELNATCDTTIGYCMWNGDQLPGFRTAEDRAKVMQECADYAAKQ